MIGCFSPKKARAMPSIILQHHDTMPLVARFIRQTAVMMTGTAAAQAIPLLAAPLLTRLYSPEEFGALAAMLAVAVIFSILSSLRYELAIPLPESESDAMNIAALALGSAFVVCVAVLLIGLIFPALVVTTLKRSSLLWETAAILAFMMASTQVFNFAATRERLFQLIAWSLVVQQAMAAGMAIAVAYAAPWLDGLIVSRLGGQIGAAVILLFAVLPWLRGQACGVQFSAMRNLAYDYRRFPQFNVPYSLLGATSRELLILSFTAMGQAAAAGQYGLARSVLLAPIGFLSSSLSQVFYREATSALGSPTFRRLTLTMLVSLAAALTPLFVLGWLWAPVAFAIVFGLEWREAGDFAAILMPIVYLSLFTSWPERIFEVRGAQHYSLVIQLLFDGLSIAAVLLALQAGAPAKSAITVYVVIQTIYHLTYLAAVFYLSKLSLGLFLGFLGLLVGLISLSIGILASVTQIAAPTLQWLVVLAATASALGTLLFFGVSQLAKRMVLIRDETPSI